MLHDTHGLVPGTAVHQKPEITRSVECEHPNTPTD
jgi:hypothetical protein